MMHIDKLFKEKLYNHEALVPEGMWEKIAPIAEEESGRAILWFWFAGLLTLLLGGYGIYKMINSDTPNDPNSLAFQEQIDDQSQNSSVDNSLASITHALENQEQNEESSLSHSDIKDNSAIANNTPVDVPKHIVKKKKHTAKTPNAKKEHVISNTVESITNVAGTPAKLVITKSYINKEGSVIKQSNLTENIGNESPVYDVIINSEVKDVNAGALLRIVEPLENIPLPTLQKQLKKKNPIAIF